MTATVLVIGAGAAGTAAAWSAARLGARVTVVSAGAGASVLAGGAIDDTPWEDAARAARITGAALTVRPLDGEVRAFTEALDLWRFPADTEPFPLLATLAGRLRPARGHDSALLDLASIPPGPVLVPRVDRASWDADTLAAAWNDSHEARARGLQFRAIDATLLHYTGEERIADADLAERHNDPARLTWLAARLREAIAGAGIAPSAVILGPWLGLHRGAAEQLTGLLGVPAGEALTGAGSPAGSRFERARSRLLEAAGIPLIHGQIERISLRDNDPDGHLITVRGTDDPMRADRILLACGGLIGGGMVYDPLERHAGGDMPESNAPSFRFSFEIIAPSEESAPHFVANGARIGIASSMFGIDMDATAWPAPGRPGLLEVAGVHCDRDGMAAPFVLAAGDIVADRPRTVLEAVKSGLMAGARAASPQRP